jgi:hypothetical protein
MVHFFFLRQLLFAIRRSWAASVFRLPMGVGEAFPGVFTANPFLLHCIKTSLNVDRFMLGTTSSTHDRRADESDGGKPACSHQTDHHPRKCLDPGVGQGEKLLGIIALQPSHNATGSVGSRDVSRDGDFDLCLAPPVNQVPKPQRFGLT